MMLGRSLRSVKKGAETKRVWNSIRTYASDHGHEGHHEEHHEAPKKDIEVNLTKVFGIGVLVAGFYVYKSQDKREEPLVKTPLYEQVEERQNWRNDNYIKRYKASFIKSYMRDLGGIGQKQFRREAHLPIPSSLIAAHSPFGDQFGAGIKTDKLGPRKERVRYFAPLPNEQ
ncbi:Piso0_003231 [Millerozyma farinosa CBS 7064]|uniref:Piso0_003231 protein n=1 Tax=Pichia sorbitophila (strain ATCC MYA-4447 / BCRC 22081 / CBS 7064 / NBRC 10061 / NRRL Y-12695) TaxID=559304 RepID=G8YHJ5_PICSO|nr:Piso0_003231 [Millerozyma farinosa CBS 7064]CCE80897.1 Piso0_003231 [Millerozyma farinosa CBS 7064]